MDGGRRGWERRIIGNVQDYPTPAPLLPFDRPSLLWYKFLSLPNLPLRKISNVVAVYVVFTKITLSTRPPVLLLLCRLSLNFTEDREV